MLEEDLDKERFFALAAAQLLGIPREFSTPRTHADPYRRSRFLTRWSIGRRRTVVPPADETVDKGLHESRRGELSGDSQ